MERFRVHYVSDGNYIIMKSNGASWGPWNDPPMNKPYGLWARIVDGVFTRVWYERK